MPANRKVNLCQQTPITLSMTFVLTVWCSFSQAAIQDAADSLKTRVVISAAIPAIVGPSPKEAVPALAEITYQGKHNFDKENELVLPFYSANTAELAKTQIRLKEAKNLVEFVASIKTTDDGKEQTFSLVIQPKESENKKKTLSVEVRYLVTGADFLIEYFADLKRESSGEDKSELVREITVINNSTLNWETKSSTSMELILKNSDEVLFNDPKFKTLNKNSKRTILQTIKASVDAETVFIDLPTISVGGMLPRNIKLVSGTQEPGDEPVSGIPSGSVIKFRGAPLANVFQMKTEITLSARLPLGVPECNDGCCLTPTELTVNQTILELGKEPNVNVASVSKNLFAPWLPLAVVDNQVLYLSAQPWDLCLVNRSELQRTVQFRDTTSAGAVPTVSVFAPGSPFTLEPHQSCSITANNYSKGVWSVALSVGTTASTSDEKARAKIIVSLSKNVADLLNSETELHDLLPFFCLDPRVKKQKGNTDLREYLEQLKQILIPLADASKKLIEAENAVSQNLEAQRALEALAQRLTNSAHREEFGKELIRIEYRRHDLERFAKKLQIDLQRAEAELLWAVKRPKLSVNGYPLDPIERPIEAESFADSRVKVKRDEASSP